MAEIVLTRGFVTVVDDILWEELSAYKWYASGHQGRGARRLIEPQRRLIFIYHQILRVFPWEISAKGLCVDHINRDPLDNRLVNLRIVTTQENMRNRTGYGERKGICFDKRHQKWKVYIDRPDLPRVNIGTFRFEAEALQALEEARSRL